jgi:chromosomal replication initiator protein
MIPRIQFGELNIIRIKKYKPSPKVKVYTEKPCWSIDGIIKIVCNYYQIPIEDIQIKTRKREILQARQIAMYFSKKFTKSSLATIGSQIGNKDHATVSHACKTITNLIEFDTKFKTEIEKFQEYFKTSLTKY